MKKDYDSTRIYRNTQKKGASQTYDTPSYYFTLRDVMINSGYEKHRLGKFLYRFRENPYYTSIHRLIFAAEIRKMTELTMILESDGFLENGSLTYKIR